MSGPIEAPIKTTQTLVFPQSLKSPDAGYMLHTILFPFSEGESLSCTGLSLLQVGLLDIKFSKESSYIVIKHVLIKLHPSKLFESQFIA